MVKFEKVTDEEIVGTERAMKGTVSYPILKGFIETNMYMAKITPAELAKEYKRDPSGLAMTLRGYAKKHRMPVAVVVRNNVLYLKRLDMEKGGKKIENWEDEVWGLTKPKKKVGETEI